MTIREQQMVIIVGIVILWILVNIAAWYRLRKEKKKPSA